MWHRVDAQGSTGPEIPIDHPVTPALPSGRNPLVLAGSANCDLPRSSSFHLEATTPTPVRFWLPGRGITAMKPLHRHRALSITTAGLLLTEFLLFLVVALSLPVIKPIYLLAVNAHPQSGQPVTSVAIKLRFGVWGLCAFR